MVQLRLRRRAAHVLGAAAIVAASTLGWTVPAVEAADPAAFRALSGAAAAAFRLPGDVRSVRQLRFAAHGLTYERYQQFFGQAEVLGGQITLYRNAAGAVALVVGAHYPAITPANAVGIARADAEAAAQRDTGAAERRASRLMIDPGTGRYFFWVESQSLDSRWVHWIDAASGAVLKKLDYLQSNHGTGVKGDTKDVDGPNNTDTADDVTTFHSASGHGARGQHWDLFSKDSRQQTYDAKNRTSLLHYVTDADNHWTVVTSDRKSPGHPALIDAQYYANVTDDYLQQRHGFNWTACGYSAMQSVAHYSRNYNNAFWNGTYTVYGDGDGTVFRELSGGLDVVAHEHAHGVTDCTSNLIYENESGALNESFSDVLGNSAEFFAAEPTTSKCVLASGQTACADWWIGEDVYLPTSVVPGFRNMADPAEDGDPDHYSERYTGTDDNGGVHSNSGIPNHAYYLLVNGGKNAGEADGHAHTGPAVTAIGLTAAERIFFVAFTGLPNNATMCQARLATAAAASTLYGSGSQQMQSTKDAWEAVGLTATLCGS